MVLYMAVLYLQRLGLFVLFINSSLEGPLSSKRKVSIIQ